MAEEVPIYAKPEGQEGEDLLNKMDKGHTPIALWSYNNIEIMEDDVTLDIGCGSGLNVKRQQEKSPNAKSFGIDYSSTCVKKSKLLNKELVDSGDIEIIEADVQKMPFRDNTINVATAFSTVFFWPNVVNCFKEVKRVLKPGGKFYIIQGLNGVYDETLMDEPRNDGCTFFNDEELKNLLLEAGFSSVTAFIRKRDKNQKLIKTSTIDSYFEELIDEIIDEEIEHEEPPISPEWLCVLGKK